MTHPIKIQHDIRYDVLIVMSFGNGQKKRVKQILYIYQAIKLENDGIYLKQINEVYLKQINEVFFKQINVVLGIIKINVRQYFTKII